MSYDTHATGLLCWDALPVARAVARRYTCPEAPGSDVDVVQSHVYMCWYVNVAGVPTLIDSETSHYLHPDMTSCDLCRSIVPRLVKTAEVGQDQGR